MVQDGSASRAGPAAAVAAEGQGVSIRQVDLHRGVRRLRGVTLVVVRHLHRLGGRLLQGRRLQDRHLQGSRLLQGSRHLQGRLRPGDRHLRLRGGWSRRLRASCRRLQALHHSGISVIRCSGGMLGQACRVVGALKGSCTVHSLRRRLGSPRRSTTLQPEPRPLPRRTAPGPLPHGRDHEPRHGWGRRMLLASLSPCLRGAAQPRASCGADPRPMKSLKASAPRRRPSSRRTWPRQSVGPCRSCRGRRPRSQVAAPGVHELL